MIGFDGTILTPIFVNAIEVIPSLIKQIQNEVSGKKRQAFLNELLLNLAHNIANLSDVDEWMTQAKAVHDRLHNVFEQLVSIEMYTLNARLENGEFDSSKYLVKYAAQDWTQRMRSQLDNLLHVLENASRLFQVAPDIVRQSGPKWYHDMKTLRNNIDSNMNLLTSGTLKAEARRQTLSIMTGQISELKAVVSQALHEADQRFQQEAFELARQLSELGMLRRIDNGG